MIISHRHRFIFVKTRKTAGTSVEVLLSGLCAEEDVVTPILPLVEGHRARNHRGAFNPLPEILEDGRVSGRSLDCFLGRRFYNHLPARIIRARVPRRVWRDYYKFTIERNPWDKVLSHFHMIRAMRHQHLTFDHYLARRRFPIDHPLYTEADSPDRMLVDRVIRYERLEEELAEVLSDLGFEWSGPLGVRAKSDYRTDRRPYQEVYREHQARVIERAFEVELDLLGYRFR